MIDISLKQFLLVVLLSVICKHFAEAVYQWCSEDDKEDDNAR